MQKNTLSSAHGTRIDHILGHKSRLSEFKKTEIVTKYFLWSQFCKTRYQLQEKKTAKNKLMEIKQYITK